MFEVLKPSRDPHRAKRRRIPEGGAPVVDGYIYDGKAIALVMEYLCVVLLVLVLVLMYIR